VQWGGHLRGGKLLAVTGACKEAADDASLPARCASHSGPTSRCLRSAAAAVVAHVFPAGMRPEQERSLFWASVCL